MNMNKRDFLGKSLNLGTGLFLTAIAAGSRVFANVAEMQEALMKFTAGKEPGRGRITLKTPEIAENGNGVPISISVESPMTDEDHVKSVIILAEDNPQAKVAVFHFTPASGEASTSTRIRLARTQNVTVVARMSNGDVYSATNNVKVTIGGCGG